MDNSLDLISPTDRREYNRKRRQEDREEYFISERLSKLEEGYNNMSKSIAKVETVVENSIGLIERFENVLDRMTITLSELNTTITKINGDVKENTKDINGMGSSINDVKSSIRVLEDRGKIDFLVIIKDNFAKVVLGGGALGFILYWIDHVLDAWLSLKK
jgi:chromosome segregation ATPase